MSIFKSKKTAKNYLDVKSNRDIEILVRKRELFKVHLIPLILNGQDLLNNIIYVPYEIAHIKDKYDSKAYKLFQKGKIDNYICNPEYKEDSYVPSRLYIVCSRNGKKVYKRKVNIW